MAYSKMEISLELLPGSPQQRHVLAMIVDYLDGKVEDPETVALHVWRLTRITMRPIRSVPPVE